MNNPFDYTPDPLCREAYRHLLDMIDSLRLSETPEDINFCRELEAGKMLGVLVAADQEGVTHNLYAFSGQLGDGGFYHHGFVAPVFDYLAPEGYFKKKEAGISLLNKELAAYEEGELSVVRDRYEREKALLDAAITEYKEKCRLSKLEREERREAGCADEREMAAMIRQSQFEKAELRRLKKRAAAALEPFAKELAYAQSHVSDLKERRRSESEALQNWLFDNFRLLNALGQSKSLSEIFADTALKIPPSGAGECCAPKLLQAAYLQGLRPMAIAECWHGRPKDGEVRIDGMYYPACRGKCLPVLTWMLQGLEVYPPLNGENRRNPEQEPEIVYENRWFCVVDKPAGMLSVPGKGKTVSVQQWLADRYGTGSDIKVAHRLDQDTSGLLVATFGKNSYKVMQSLFAKRDVKKTYVAELAGDFKASGNPECGRIDLPLAPDWLDRPRQRVSFDNGKEAVTDYEVTGISESRCRILFYPQTGRTHQLRVHSASAQGLGLPIAGDRLYGRNMSHDNERLHLHAHKLEFVFPLNGRHYSFESPVPF